MDKKLSFHLVFDFSPLYFKYAFRLMSGKLKHLTTPVNLMGAYVDTDITCMYNSIAEIENKRRYYESAGVDVTVSVCFDMPSDRKNDDSEYKSGRKSVLTPIDHKLIGLSAEVLRIAGHNTYMFPGKEADDLIYNIVKNTADNFDATLVYTNDKDLLINVSDSVGVIRHKTDEDILVKTTNYEQYLNSEFKCRIPYNAIVLFLATVGDVSDHVKGITKFGPAAFNKLVDYIESNFNIDWVKCGDLKYLDDTVNKLLESGYFKDEQCEQLKASYSLVRPKDLEFNMTFNKSTNELRMKAYEELQFKSLFSY